MSFFEPPARPPEAVARAVAVSPPAWLGPPHNTLPGIVPVELVIARTDETVVALAGIQAYPAGFGFTLCLRLRNLSPREEQQFPYLLDRAPFGGDPLPDEFLRFGVQFADGQKATNLDRPSYDPEHEPDRPVLLQHGGGRWRRHLGHGALGVAAATGGAVRFRVCVAGQGHRGVAGRDRRRIDPRSGRARCDPLALTTIEVFSVRVTLIGSEAAGHGAGVLSP